MAPARKKRKKTERSTKGPATRAPRPAPKRKAPRPAPRQGQVLPGKPGRRPTPGLSPSQLIDRHIGQMEGWHGKALARMRALILEADPDMVEEWKWSIPVWSHDGLVTTGETYTKAVKLTFARGAFVPDPSKLFNASLGGGTRRAIDIHEGEEVDARAFKALVRSAVALNQKRAKAR